ncbi:hypothetical protein Tcan_03835 [Toxocara canis]|uniref:Uncharacterized protein n=1 Tax=Toxocara canis TaxID=6265 RepID=A0A0B2VD09_TOXCA|nr:hypothetical protein Tcan_03835 [Toxocara canis]
MPINAVLKEEVFHNGCERLSVTKKHCRFKVEKLCDVRCAIVSDVSGNEPSSLIDMTSDDSFEGDKGERCACLSVSLGRDRYTMEVYESSLHDLLNESSLPNVCILGIINETTEQGLSAVRCIRELLRRCRQKPQYQSC